MTAQVQLPASVSDASPSSPSTSNPEELPNRPEASSPPTLLTVRMIMQGKEVGSIIGKKGDNVKRYREESGAKINISDASCPERIVTVTGSIDQVHKAFELICTKFEEIRDLNTQTNPSITFPPISLKLVIPASQCGSLIGKGGTKIKDIRENSGASVQVASEMLPGSTERAVTVSGPTASINRCLQEICNIMLESPPKGATIPYRPKPTIQAPLMYAAAAGAAAQAAYAVPHMQAMAVSGNIQQTPSQVMAQTSPAQSSTATTSAEQPRQPQQSAMVSSAATTAINPPYSTHSWHSSSLPRHTLCLTTAHKHCWLLLPQQQQQHMEPLLGMGGLGLMGTYMARPMNNNYLASHQQTQSTEMIIPNELIGCIIGRGGAKINEIRQLSGAQIKISNCEEGNSDRKVTITGVPETITLAAYLINTSIEIHKNQLLNTSDPSAISSTLANPQQQALQQSIAATMLPAAAVTTAYTKPLSVHPYSTTGAYGLSANQLAGFTSLNPAATLATYDPKTLLNASKFKVLPSTSILKQEHRFAPY